MTNKIKYLSLNGETFFNLTDLIDHFELPHSYHNYTSFSVCFTCDKRIESYIDCDTLLEIALNSTNKTLRDFVQCAYRNAFDEDAYDRKNHFIILNK